MTRAVGEFGRLDMASNDSGILGPMCPMSEETGDGFDQPNAVNLRGVGTFLKHGLLHMTKQGGGAIVNCSSLGGPVGPPGRAADHATKHGVIGLTKSATASTRPRQPRLRFFEMYADEAAYKAHIASAHFQKYAATTRPMIVARRLIETEPIQLSTNGN